MNYYYNNASVAQLGHGKWKRALGHTLLLIGFLMGFGMLGAYAQEATNGLYLYKTWTPNPDDPTGASGTVRLETFVTGDVIVTETHKPTDIVLVLDVSGSMEDPLYNPLPSASYSYNSYGNNQYYYYYNGEYYRVYRDTETTGFIWTTTYYFLYFTVGNTTYYLDGTGTTTRRPSNTSTTNTIFTGVLYEAGQIKIDALKDAVEAFVDIIAQDAVDYDVDHRISVVKYASNEWYTNEADITEGNHTYQPYQQYNWTYNYTEVVLNRRAPKTEAQAIKSAVNALSPGGATAADYGMTKAKYLLASIPASEYAERDKVVVMFTDGAPTYQSSFDATVASNTIANAYILKNSGTVNNTNYNFNATVFSVGVFDLETSQIRTYMSRTSSNYPEATSMTNNCTQESDNYYFKAESAEALGDIFEAIANQSGSAAADLGVGTIVQDVVAPSFQLNIPEGATPGTTIKAYAPKCNGKNGNAFTFEPEIDGTAGRLIIDNNGVVVDTEGRENRLEDDVVSFDEDEQTLTFTNFNFSAMYVAQEVDGNGNPIFDNQGNPICFGRKLVILIPLEIADGSWGDGIHTNGEMSVIYPNGDTSNPIPFNNPTANVLGSVWTEVITEMPEGFDANNIDSPEDLAWFISEVNGRCGYHENNTIASHPNLNGRLTADIDMSAHNWVPIGSGYVCEVVNGTTQYVMQNGQKVKLAYSGTFDGNGHVITGLKNNASKYYKLIEDDLMGVVVFPGMFSTVSGTVKNVFVLDADFRGKHHNPNFVHHGIIADTLAPTGNIFNCEAAGRITCNNDDPTNDQKLIFGGLVGLNQGTIHSTMAMAELTAYTMGGMIGENRSSFSNGFTNGVYNYLDHNVTGKYAGGIAAINTGTINNCYVRFERDNTDLFKMGDNFGMIYGNNSGTVQNCYTPQIVTWSRPDYQSNTTEIITNTTIPTTVMHPADNTVDSYTLAVDPTFYNMFTNDNMTGGSWGTLGSYNVYNNGTPLLTKLNANKGSGATWKRTTAGAYSEGAGEINDDFPVLAFEKFAEGDDAPFVTCLASSDGIRIDYSTSLVEMLHRHNNGNMNENTNISNEYTQHNADYYKVTEHPTIYKGTINLYANDDVTLETETGGKDGVADNCTAEGVMVYIDEDISLLQDATSIIDAYTAQTMKSVGTVQGDQQAGDRWHNVSSSLKDSQFGWYYLNNQQVEHNFEPDPCGWSLNTYDGDHALFPIDLNTYRRTDFYCFFEPEYHWVNFRRNGDSHWHMDDYTKQINYYYNQPNEDYSDFEQIENNETQFLPGKGYLIAVDESQWFSMGKNAQLLQNRGTLNNGDVNIPVTCTEGIELTGRQGYNLLGNPYQSYLDFEEFVDGNEDLWGTDDQFAQTYAVYDPEYSKYIQYKSNSSKGSLTANQYINMHQGFFIKTSQTTNAHFTNDMRTNAGTPNFRGEQPAFPLINFIVADNEGNTDVAVIELNRNENEGATKLRVGSSKGHIYFRYNKENLAIFFRDNAKDNQILNFVADENGNYTLSWNTANADFNSLTLIDNITGVKTDMLAHDHYTFEGRTDDYDTRFKIVFDLNNYNEDEVVESETFAFFNEGNLIVNGEGYFDVIDVLGRVVYAAQLTDTQNTVSLPHNLSGVCLLRISNGDKVKVQKMYVR
ncbi:MAG: VWA domain-containing protein [Muribaculaceae bacterium]|nr:VWA domain-containing protein [Muribaculaceae bacterium]